MRPETPAWVSELSEHPLPAPDWLVEVMKTDADLVWRDDEGNIVSVNF